MIVELNGEMFVFGVRCCKYDQCLDGALSWIFGVIFYYKIIFVLDFKFLIFLFKISNYLYIFLKFFTLKHAYFYHS